MKLTLNIIAHELAALGTVAPGSAKAHGRCVDVRLAADGPLEGGMLYVTTASDAARLAARVAQMPASGDGAPLVLAVGSDAHRLAAAHAALTLEGACSVIEAFTFLQDVFLRYRRWEQELDTSLIEDRGMQDLFDLSEKFLVNNVVVVDPALKLLAHTRNIPCDDPITVELIKHGYHTEENIRKFQLNKRFEPWATQNGFIINDTYAICKYTTAVFSFKAAGSFSLIVVMMCNNADPEPWLLDTFIIFLTRVAHYSMRDYAGGMPSGSAFNAFVNDLLSGALNDPAVLEERRRYLGLPAEGPYCLFAVDASSARPLIERIVADTARNIAPAKAMTYGDEIIVLCFSCHGCVGAHFCASSACPPSHSTVVDRIGELLAEYDLKAGRSTRFKSLDTLPQALSQARAAREAGSAYCAAHGATAERANTMLFDFDEYYLEYLVGSATRESREMLSTLRCCSLLRQVKRYDDEHHTDNYPFLRLYLRYERRTTVVAEKLHMHRNNVKYRMDRLKELYGIDTENPRERYELMTAYRVLDALGTPDAHEPVAGALPPDGQTRGEGSAASEGDDPRSSAQPV